MKNKICEQKDLNVDLKMCKLDNLIDLLLETKNEILLNNKNVKDIMFCAEAYYEPVSLYIEFNRDETDNEEIERELNTFIEKFRNEIKEASSLIEKLNEIQKLLLQIGATEFYSIVDRIKSNIIDQLGILENQIEYDDNDRYIVNKFAIINSTNSILLNINELMDIKNRLSIVGINKICTELDIFSSKLKNCIYTIINLDFYSF